MRDEHTAVMSGVEMVGSVRFAELAGISYELLQRWMGKGIMLPDATEDKGGRGYMGKHYWWVADRVSEVEALLQRIEACPYGHSLYEPRR